MTKFRNFVKSLTRLFVKRSELQQALINAEKVASCSTSLINRHWLSNQGILDFILLFRDMKAKNDKTLKLKILTKLIQDNRTDLQLNGLIVVLMCKAGNAMLSELPKDKKVDKITGILIDQHSIAEIIEIFRVKKLLFDKIENLQSNLKCGNNFSSNSDIIFGNKIALLSGDFFFTHIFSICARNDFTMEMFGKFMRDHSETKFYGNRDDQNYPLPSNPSEKYNGPFDINLNEIELTKNFDPNLILGHAEHEWTYRIALNHGSTLGYCCRGALKIPNIPELYLDQSYKFGRNFAMTLQAFTELEPFRRHRIGEDEQFSLVSAPVLFHMEHDPSIYEEIKKGKVSIANVNYSKLHQAVLNGPGIHKTKDLIKIHSKKALEALEVFGHSNAKESLKNLVNSIKI